MKYDAAQLEVIQAEEEEVVVNAGPGSGKTRTLVGRLAADALAGVDPERMVVVTYTNAAADEVAARLAKELGVAAYGGQQAVRIGYCGTLHGLCLRLLRRNGGAVGVPAEVTVLDEQAAEHLFEQSKTRVRWKGSDKAARAVLTGPGPDPVVDDAEKGVGRMLRAAYYGEQSRLGMLDFDSLLFYGARLAQTQVEIPWTHLYADEVQDAGPLDMTIYQGLPFVRRFFVGDPDQAIYGFRNGQVGCMLALAGRRFTLETSYRSAPDICLTANLLVTHNTRRWPKVMRPASTAAEGQVSFWSGLPTPQHEVGEIVKDMAGLPENWTCAVLVRSNALADFYGATLDALGVRVRRSRRSSGPPGWGLACRLLALMTAPGNMFLARLVLEDRGLDPAWIDSQALAALEAGVSLNAHALGLAAPSSLDAVPGVLGRQGVSPGAVRAIQELVRSLPAGSGLVDLLMRVRSHQTQVDGEGVDVMTLHGAKGREWDAVYMPAMEEEVTPGRATGEAVEEERRLVFVGVTRARSRLVLSSAAARECTFTQRIKPATVSRFFLEAAANVETEANSG